MKQYKSIATIVAALVVACLVFSSPVVAGDKLDVNTATIEQLKEIKGVGEKTAKAIEQYRKEHGPFASIDDLIEVKGIGEKKLEELRKYLTVGSS